MAENKLYKIISFKLGIEPASITIAVTRPGIARLNSYTDPIPI